MQNKKRTESSKDAYQTAGSEERKKASDRREEKTLERREEKRREEDGRHYERSKQEKQKTEKRDWGLCLNCCTNFGIANLGDVLDVDSQRFNRV